MKNENPLQKMNLNFDLENENNSLKNVDEEKVENLDILFSNDIDETITQKILHDKKIKTSDALSLNTNETIIQENLKNLENKKIKIKKYKSEESIAKKYKKISYFWISICILSIIFGITSIIGFGNEISIIISNVTNDSGVNLNALFFHIFLTILKSFEAILFTFFITFSFFKYIQNRRIWNVWWNKTEPVRNATSLKKAQMENSLLKDKLKVMSISFSSKEYSGDNLKKKLLHIDKENSEILLIIKQHKNNNKKKH